MILRKPTGLPAVLLSIALLHCPSAAHADHPKPLKIPITRDTWVSSYSSEVNGNNGGAQRLKTKGIQELSLLDFPTETLQGHCIESATLHFRTASEAPQLRVTTSTVSSDWTEGTAAGYEVQTGSASFRWARQEEQPWAGPGSDITAVIAGIGHSIWSFADASPTDSSGWQALPISPDVIAACVAGLSCGIALIDDVGSEYTRDGDRFTYHLFPNRFLYSREAGDNNSPYLTIQTGDQDASPPHAVTPFHAAIEQPTRALRDCAPSLRERGLVALRPGAVRLQWVTPQDQGPAGIAGFDLRFAQSPTSDWDTAIPVPRYLIPMAAAPGVPVETILPDLGWGTEASISFLLRPVDRAGNRGPISRLTTRVAPEPNLPVLPWPCVSTSSAAEHAQPLECDGLTIGIVDLLDKVAPQSGRILPDATKDYLRANHLFDTGRRLIQLHAARNEFLGFQIVLQGESPQFSAQWIWTDPEVLPAPEFSLVHPVPTASEPFPDPLVPCPAVTSIPPPNAPEGQQFTSILTELYVPHEAESGPHSALLRLTSGETAVDIMVSLTVWDFTLPDYLSFIPEMNCYGLPQNERDYYRLAHRHRTNLNRLPYPWRGRNMDRQTAPDWDGTRFHWAAFDQRFGPLLDGSAFADLPRAGVPVDTFYLPLNEDWPVDIETGFLGGYWADIALSAPYRAEWITAARAFAEHLSAQEWSHPVFQFYLNNKVYHKDTDWRRSSAPWIFDEPVNTQDFWALRWFGTAFQEATQAIPSHTQLAFRCDISRPEWQRNLLDGLLQVHVCGGAFYQYADRVLEQRHRDGQMVFLYGTSNPIDQPNTQPAAWCIDTWARGLDGVLPWQTIGNDDSWKTGDELALFYPGTPAGQTEPVPSIRLKAFLRGQQDTEYCTLLQETLDLPRWVIGDLVRTELGLTPRFSTQGADDAGGVHFNQLTPAQLATLRIRIGQLLDRASPPVQRKLVDLHPCRNTTPQSLFIDSAQRRIEYLGR